MTSDNTHPSQDGPADDAGLLDADGMHADQSREPQHDDEDATDTANTRTSGSSIDEPVPALVAVPGPAVHAVPAAAAAADVDDPSSGEQQQRETPDQNVVAIPRLSLVTANSPEHQHETAVAIDRLSLEQALLDVEVANARVIDLTSRLVEANQRNAATRAEADALRAHIVSLEAAEQVRRAGVEADLAARQAALDAQAAHLDAQKASTAYRWAAKVWNLRNALRS